MMHMVTKLARNDEGATAIEYALIASLVSIAIVGALLVLNSSAGGMFQYIVDNVGPALGG
ncbi:Flp family type IVb pilin [Pelagibacterium sp.]|uniref:Flp family type IVb pilin n=1 Tax=Pelagibacterium sp. TaxID=1967288 RepID=UPI003A925159